MNQLPIAAARARPSACSQVKPGMEAAAAFLETRRYAGMLGATTEFEKEEGQTVDREQRVLYVAITKARGKGALS